MKKLTLPLLIIALAFTACKKEVNNNVSVPGKQEFRTKYLMQDGSVILTDEKAI